MKTYLCIDKSKKEFYILYNDTTPEVDCYYNISNGIISADEEEKILSLFNSHINDTHIIYDVVKANPYYNNDSHSYFIYEDAAAIVVFNSLVKEQDGRSSYNDDDGGMDYSVDTLEVSLLEFALKYADDYEELIEFINKEDEEDE